MSPPPPSPSSVPALPNETITLIFNHLYASLGVSLAKEELDLPLLAPFVFAPFLRVSKTWYHLTLPFFVRFIDNGNPAYITELVKKYQLERAVETVYLNPVIPVRRSLSPVPGQPEMVAGLDSWDAEEYVWSREVGIEAQRWFPLLQLVAPTLRRLEVGWRGKPQYVDGRREPLEHQPGFDYDDGVGWTAGEATLAVLGGDRKRLPPLPSLQYLRINLLPGADLREYAHAISRSPNLRTLIISSYTSAPYGNSEYGDIFNDSFWQPECDCPPPSLPYLERFVLLRFKAPRRWFENNIAAGLLHQNRRSLRHLHLELDLGADEDDSAPEKFEAFNKVEFPRLESLTFRSKDYFLDKEVFWSSFPAVRRADLAAYYPPPTDYPPLLTDLTMSGGVSAYVHVHNRLGTQLADKSTAPLSQTLRLILDGELESSARPADVQLVCRVALRQQADGQVVPGTFETGVLDEEFLPDSPTYAALEAASSAEGGPSEEAEEQEDSDGGESDGEDLELDWDAEEGEEFSHLWSEEKQREGKMAAFLSTYDLLRPSFPSVAAFEAARDEALERLRRAWAADVVVAEQDGEKGWKGPVLRRSGRKSVPVKR